MFLKQGDISTMGIIFRLGGGTEVLHFTFHIGRGEVELLVVFY